VPVFWSSVGKGLRYLGTGAGFDDTYTDGDLKELKVSIQICLSGKWLMYGGTVRVIPSERGQGHRCHDNATRPHRGEGFRVDAVGHHAFARGDQGWEGESSLFHSIWGVIDRPKNILDIDLISAV
jgi:hypothetical protein